MKNVIIAAIAVGLLASPAIAQVNQGQGGAPSAQSGGTIDNPRTNMDKGANSGSHKDTAAPHSTTGTAPAPSGNNPAQGNAGRSGGEGGSGR